MGNKQWVLSIEGLRPRVLPPIGCKVTTGQVPPCGAFYWPAAQPLRLLLAGASACLSAARPGPARAATALREPLPPPPPRAPEVTARGRRRVSAGRRPWGEHEAGWCGEGRAAGPGRGERSWRLAASGRHGSPDGCVRGWGGRRGEGSVGRAGPGPARGSQRWTRSIRPLPAVSQVASSHPVRLFVFPAGRTRSPCSSVLIFSAQGLQC